MLTSPAPYTSSALLASSSVLAGSAVSLLATVVAVLASARFLEAMVRHRGTPATRPLTGVAVALLVGAMVHLAVVELAPVRAALGVRGAPTDTVGGIWILPAFDLAAVVGGLWFLFALQYTGRGERASPVANAMVAVLLVSLIGASAALAAFSPSLGVSADTLNLVLGVTLVLAEAVALLGAFLVVAATLRTKAIPGGQTGLLAGAVGTVLVLPFVAATFQAPVATPVAVAAASLLSTTAVNRYRVFETLPAATVVARDRVVDEMDEGVLVVDDSDRVRDYNPVAETLLGVDESAVGNPLADAAPALARAASAAGADPFDVRLDSAVASVTTDAVTDAEGRSLGRLFVCRDVTDERERENRLAVLTQLAAGGTQQQLREVAATADDVVSGDREPAAAGNAIHETATTVASLVARVRDVERAFAETGTTEREVVDAAEAVRDATAPNDLRVSRPDESDAPPVAAEPALLTATLGTLLAGAATNADAAAVRAVPGDGSVAFRVEPYDVRDEGSIADHALQVARLAAEHADWTVQTDRDAADGDETCVAVLVPTAESDTEPRRAARGVAE